MLNFLSLAVPKSFVQPELEAELFTGFTFESEH